MKEIKLNGKYGIGKTTKVSDADFDNVSQYKWYLSKLGYVRGTSQDVYLHRFLFDNVSGEAIDHKDGDKLNNQRENLRVCSKIENERNKSKQANNVSGYKGVSWNKNAGKWLSMICLNQKRIYLGIYDDKIEAAKAYNNAALKYHGEYARLNEV